MGDPTTGGTKNGRRNIKMYLVFASHLIPGNKKE